MNGLMLALCCLLGIAAPTTASTMEAMQAQMASVSPKTVVLVFDVSGSMEDNQTLINAREATIKLLKAVVKPGDQVVITTFDIQPKTVLDRRVAGDADLQAVIEAVPSRVTQSQGTNIRWAHHRVLRMLEKDHPTDSYIVVVTDSFNDPPAPNDPHMAEYRQYYDSRGLTRYPDTPQNRDYERLLAKRHQLKVETLGIGVEIDEDSGRPVERLPQTAPVSAETPASTEEPVRNEPARSSFNPWWLAAAVVALALIALALLRPRLSAEDVVLVEGARLAGPFRMSSGSVVELGGPGHGDGAFGVPIPGTAAPIAFLRRGGGAYRLEVAPLPEQSPPEVQVNGEKVLKSQPLRFADEIQVRVPRPDGARSVRFTFERYNRAAHGGEV